MKTKFYSLTFLMLLGSLLLTVNVKAQESQPVVCGTDYMTEQLFEKYPGLREEYEMHQRNLVENAKRYANKRAADTTYVIPVVFHVIHQYGSENISDQQVFEAMEIINEDFQKMNNDRSLVIPEFEDLIGDVNIEFRLANKDPKGNCTNGINHIYSHETQIGDNYSKLNYWSRSHYLNVWVIDKFEREPNQGILAGYSQKPPAVDGLAFFVDGVILRDDFLGVSGTGDPNNTRTLTHEIGHYLGLGHPWGDGPVEEECGDDGILDTPPTRGYSSRCPDPEDADICQNGVIENYQNFMDYASCTHMFTKAQASFMRSVMEGETANRNKLWQQSNLELTGTTDNQQELCAPMPDFHTSNRLVCTGTPVTFSNYTWRANASSYEWTFEGGSPATSSSAEPNVTYSQPGSYDVTLTATNSAGSETVTLENYIYVSDPNTATYEGKEPEDLKKKIRLMISLY